MTLGESLTPQGSGRDRVPGRAAAGLDTTVPSVARVYDFLLGGKDHFPSDRDFAVELTKRYPAARRVLRANRVFLGRAVRYLANSGVEQFLDIGTGLPTACNVHEIAHRITPKARVVYVDCDPQVVAHAQALLAGDPATTPPFEATYAPRRRSWPIPRSAG